ncbi:MAG: hypothetical protein AAB797_03775 [Patescibacteria group bacterium]
MFNKKVFKIVLVGAAVLSATWWGWNYWEKYQYQQIVEEMRVKAEAFEAEQERVRVLIEADTYGGAMPQETLEMFIKAVEAGDYELASKYFVVEKQEEELEILKETQRNNNIDFLLKFIREAKIIEGYFSNNNSLYIIKKPIFISFIKYPQGLWKINEI